MRTQEPSRRWLRRFEAAYVAAGGWAGPATLRAIEEFVFGLYRAGATPLAAGLAAAAENRLHREREMYAELAMVA